MRRKDGQPKAKARRNLPSFECGFRDNRDVASIRNPALNGEPAGSTVVSLFAGCGGLDLGLLGGFTYNRRLYESLPFQIVYAADNLPDAVQTYELNLSDHIANIDLATTPASALPPAQVLTGGFPCQDFSSSGPKTGFAGDRGQLYTVLLDYMQTHQPEIVIGENVTYLQRLNNGEFLETILSEFEAAGYGFDVWELYGPDYGLSQSRRRLILIGVRSDIPGFPEKPKPTHQGSYEPIDAAIDDLLHVSDEAVPNQSQFFISSRATAGGGQGDHKNEPGKVAYCIRANARGRIQFHHKLDRRLTVRECARLQSFPDEFVFPFTTQRNLTLIGNAVPPILGHAVGSSVAAFLATPPESREPWTHPRHNAPEQGQLFDRPPGH